MRTLTKIVGGVVLAGVLGMGALIATANYVSHFEKKEEQKVEQRNKIYESVLDLYEKQEEPSKNAELEIILKNGIKTIYDTNNLKKDYILADKAFTEHFVQLIGIYSDSLDDNPKNISSESIDYITESTKYMSGFVNWHKKPLAAAGKSTITTEDAEKLRKNPDRLLEFVRGKNESYLAFFDAAEKVLDSDIEYLRMTVEFTDSKSDEDSRSFGRIAGIFKDKRESAKRMIGLYRSLVEQSTKNMETYSSGRRP